MEIYTDERGLYKLVEGDKTIVLDVPDVLALLHRVLEKEYSNCGLNKDIFFKEHHRQLEIKQMKKKL